MNEDKTQRWIDENIAPIVKDGLDQHGKTDIKLPPLPAGYGPEVAAAMRNYARAALQEKSNG